MTEPVTTARTINRQYLPNEFRDLADKVDRLSRTRGEQKRRLYGADVTRRRLATVAEKRDALQARIDAQMTWLMANPGHALEAEREARWRDGLNQYCALRDLLDDAIAAGLLDVTQGELVS